MNRKTIGFRIEAGPNISQNPDLGANAGEATKQPATPTRLTRAKIMAGSLVAGMVGPSERQIQAALDEEDRQKVVHSEMDIDTGAITEVYGDGRRVAVEPFHPTEMPEGPAPTTPPTPPEKPQA